MTASNVVDEAVVSVGAAAVVPAAMPGRGNGVAVGSDSAAAPVVSVRHELDAEVSGGLCTLPEPATAAVVGANAGS